MWAKYAILGSEAQPGEQWVVEMVSASTVVGGRNRRL